MAEMADEAAAPAAAAEGEDAPTAQAPPKPPSQAKFAARFARDLAGELIPPERRPLVLTISLILYTIVIVLITKACSGG